MALLTGPWVTARRARVAALCALLWLAVAGMAEEATFTNDERILKVAFLYNFSLYSEWPAPPVAGLVLCVLGRDQLGPALDALASRQVNGKPLLLRRIDVRADVTACHMLYIAAAADIQTATIALDLQRKPILSVSDDANAEVAMIHLGREGNRLVFDVDNTRARAAGLVLSSKLLRLARSVR